MAEKKGPMVEADLMIRQFRLKKPVTFEESVDHTSVRATPEGTVVPRIRHSCSFCLVLVLSAGTVGAGTLGEHSIWKKHVKAWRSVTDPPSYAKYVAHRSWIPEFRSVSRND